MAVVKSPKNNKRKCLWVQKNSNKNLQRVTCAKKKLKWDKFVNVGWGNVYSKKYIKLSIKNLYFISNSDVNVNLNAKFSKY